MVKAIRVDGLGKRYRLHAAAAGDGDYHYRSLREDLMHWAAAPLRWLRRASGSHCEDFWALKDVCFDVEPGEVIGFVGRNGAGKSTLLKVLSRITHPTTGHIEIRGRIGSLLEVGTGFHPELSGRENIFLNGALLGMARQEVRRKFDAIVSFAEVERFLDTPVKHYSSGMYVRLAFAVAAHLEPEVLIVDEVLAVGDAEFQKKCLAKMGDVAGQGRTILFVSHNMAAVQALCTRAFLLSRGEVVQSGDVAAVVRTYLEGSDVLSSTPLGMRKDRSGAGRFRFRELRILDADGQERGFGVTGEDMSVQIEVDGPAEEAPLPSPLDVAVVLRDYHGQKLTELASYFTGQSPQRVGDTRTLTCRVPRLPLLAGQYRIDLWCGTSSETQDLIADAALLRVEPGNYFRNRKDARLPSAEKHGCIMVPQDWSPSAPTP